MKANELIKGLIPASKPELFGLIHCFSLYTSPLLLLTQTPFSLAPFVLSVMMKLQNDLALAVMTCPKKVKKLSEHAEKHTSK